MRLNHRSLRRAVAASAVAALSVGVLAVTAVTATTASAAEDGTVASGADWAVTQVAGGFEVTLDLDAPLPVVDDAPVITVDGEVLGLATESADGLSLSVLTTDPTVADADDIGLGWSTGDTSKVAPTNSPVTEEPAKAVRPVTQQEVEDLVARDGSDPGTFAYTQDDYDFGDQAIAMAGIGGIKGELTGRIYLPTTGGPRPTVILLHGRHTSCGTVVAGTTNPLRWPCVPGQTEIPSYKGYDGTGQTLASHGYAVVSISANAINANDAQLTADNGALARGQLIIDSLTMLKNANAGTPVSYFDNALNRTQTLDQALDAPQADVGTPDLNTLDASSLVGRFDLTNVGVMGHSRGGEGATSAVQLNQALAQPFGIKSVLPLAPVDFARSTVGNTAMLVMLPYCDGDVSNQQGQHFTDDSRYSYDDNVLLSTVWVMGANHNFFNTVWTPGKYAYSTSDDWGATSTDPTCGALSPTTIRLTADQEYNVGTAYMSAWFRLTLGGENTFLDQFDGTIKPTLSSVPTADIRVINQAPNNQRVDIEPFTATTSHIRTFGTATAPVCASASGRTIPQPLPYCATTSTLRSTSAMPHWTPASYAPNVPATPMTKLTWTSLTGAVKLTVPPAARNAAAYSHLVFKTAPDESVLTGTDLTLTVTDSAGATWSSLVSALNPLAVKRMPSSTSTTLNKIVLQQVSVPIASMTGINTADIREVGLAAATGADGTVTGGVYLSDLALQRSSVGTPVVLSAAPTMNVASTSVEEGNGADSKQAAVVLSKASTKTVTGYYTLIGSTAATSKAGLAAEKVTFAPGVTCVPVTIPTFGDLAPTAGSTSPTATPVAATTAYKEAISYQTNVVNGSSAFGFVNVREDDGVTGAAFVIPPVGVQGDVCAEYAASLLTFPLTTTKADPAPGDSVTVTGSGFRSGESVAFTDGTTVLGAAVANASGAVSLAVPFAADAVLGAHTLKAVGAGSGRTATVALEVLAPTTTALTLSPATPGIKTPVTLSAAVAGISGAGSVTFRDGSVVLGTAPVTGGVATLPLPSGFLAGSHSVSAAFAKTGTSNSSTSNAVSFTLVKGASTVMLGLSAPSTTYGAGATGSVSVAGGAGGTVKLTYGDTSTTLTLPASGAASFALPASLGAGDYTVSASYSGSDTLLASGTTAAPYSVDKAGSDVTAKSKFTVKSGKNLTVKGKVTGVSGALAPSGKVKIVVGGTTVGVLFLGADGKYSQAVQLTGKGIKTVRVVYTGDANYEKGSDKVKVQVK